MLAVLNPRADQGGIIRGSSLVYIGIRLTFAASIVAFGTWKLRKWNPGYNEPREQTDETETEVVESIYEVREERAEVPVGVGAMEHAEGALAGGRVVERSLGGNGAGNSHGSAPPFDDSTGATGLHVPRRTHHRVAAAPGHTARPGPTRSSGVN